MKIPKRKILLGLLVGLILLIGFSYLVWGIYTNRLDITRTKQIIVNGAIQGSIFALLSLGFTLIYGVSGIINLGHGAFFMIGAYIFSILIAAFSVAIPTEFSTQFPTLTLIAASILTGIIGSIFYRLLLHEIVGDDVAILVVSICGCIIAQQLIYIFLGPNLGTQMRVPPLLQGNFPVWGVTVSRAMALGGVASAALFIALWVFVSKTKLGKAMKALSQDREAAMLMGISKERIFMLTAAISAMLASIAGILITSSTSGVISAFSWLQPLAASFSIVVLGGLGSIKGTLIGGFIFGYAETAVALLDPQGGGALVPAVPFVVMLVTLIIRPKGLFGKRIEME